MGPNAHTERGARGARNAVIGVAATIGLVACSTLVVRQGWHPGYGPVVPHDTFPADCSLCHVGGDWHTIKKEFVFDHEGETGVPLNGAHAEAACLLCHNDRGPVAAFVAQGCAGCHEDVHRGQLGRNCGDCHSEQTWIARDAIARHNRTRFPLVGAHAAAACFRCHEGAPVGNFSGLDIACTSCHQSDLARATSPDHVAQGWVTDCQRCHIPVNWRPARFVHPPTFPLVGGHAGQACAACHQGNAFTGLSTDCASCHQDDFNATTNPSHIAAGFGTNCAQCHTTTGWGGAAFNHPATFPLSGGHAGHSCTACHVGGVYTGLSTDCASCHLDDYQATSNPNHAASGLGTACASCHSTNAWRPATFNHTFIITSGPHQVSCNQCHLVPAQPQVFSCTHCHVHSQLTMDKKHNQVPGYAWVSAACVGCHPTGH